jgi:GDP-L-fucose synthase
LGKIPQVKIWVTGATGSLGKSLIESLATEGYSSILAPTRDELDLTDLAEVESYVAEHNPTHVFHLAAQVFGISGHQQHPEASLLTNTLIDHSVFSGLFKSPPQWVYYASTVAAYGYPHLSLPLVEDDFLVGKPHGSEFGYAASKRFALNYLELLRQQHETSFAYGLSTNLFGSGDRFLEGRGHVVISLLEKARRAKMENKSLEVWGTGSASRDFLSTTDAAKIMVSLIDVNAGVVNIASGVEISISEIADYIVEAFDLPGYKFVGVNEGITNRVCSVLKLKSLSKVVDEIDTRKSLRNEIINYAKMV